MKTLVVTDLHLMDEELPYTKGATHNSLIILDELIRVTRIDKEIGLVVFLGDITNGQPKKLETKMQWESRLDKLKRIVNSRHKNMPDITYWGRDGSIGAVRNRLITLKGNHDFKFGDMWCKEPSYFDDLLEKDMLMNPEAIEFEDNNQRYYYQFRNYGEGDKTLDERYIQSDKVIVFAHDWFHGESLPAGYRHWTQYGRMVYELKSAVAGADVLIQGHSHSRYEPIHLQHLKQEAHLHPQKQEVTVYIPGTNARTPNTDDMKRNEGYNLIIDTEDFYVGDICIPLKPWEDYFK